MVDTWNGAKKSFKGMSSDELWFAQNVKKCPKKHGGCDRPINKNGGCMHMTCRKTEGGCGFEFCWLCLGPWKTHGSSTGGYYACNNYVNMGKSGQLKGEAKLAYEAASTEEAHKERLKFYEFYVQRHVFMRDSANGAKERDLSPLLFKLAMCLSLNGEVKMRDTEKVQVLVRANKMVEKCRRVLQWVYVASYYFPREAGPYALFKHNHDALEGHTEHLNRLVSFGSQLGGVEKSWDQMIQEGGSAVVAVALREVDTETNSVKQYLDSFMGEAVFETYFREAKRDTNKLPSGEMAGVSLE
jgi:ariadne-1